MDCAGCLYMSLVSHSFSQFFVTLTEVNNVHLNHSNLTDILTYV